MLIRNRLILFSILMLLLSPNAVAGEAKSESSIEFDLTNAPPSVEVEIDGELYTFLIDPSLKKRILISPRIAAKLKLSNRSFVPIKADVDGEIFEVKTHKIKMKINDGENKKRKVFWLDKDYWAPFDGVISGSSLDFDRLSFSLPATIGKNYKVQSFEMVSEKDWRVPVAIHDGLPIKVNVSFKPHLELSRANLILTQMLKHHKLIEMDNVKTLDVKREFGVKAQVMNAFFSSPANLFGRNIQSGLVQVNTSYLEVGSSDYDEVIVQGLSKKKNKNLLPELLLTKDLLNECIKIEFVKATATVHIHCEDKL